MRNDGPIFFLNFPQLLVHTMHKYVIEILIKPEDSSPTCIRFPETTFIAVTSYQNNAVSSLRAISKFLFIPFPIKPSLPK